MLLAFEHGMLPANLHFNEPNPNNKSLQDGTLKVSPHAAAVILQQRCRRKQWLRVAAGVLNSPVPCVVYTGGDGGDTLGGRYRGALQLWLWR